MIALEWFHQPHRYGHRHGRWLVAAVNGGRTIAIFHSMPAAITWAGEVSAEELSRA